MADNGYMTTTSALRTETHLSYRTSRIAFAKAREFANLNDVVEDREVEVGEIFETRIWNGSATVSVWLRYYVEQDDDKNFWIKSERSSVAPRPCDVEFGFEHKHDDAECEWLVDAMRGDGYYDPAMDYPEYDPGTAFFEREGRPMFPNEY